MSNQDDRRPVYPVINASQSFNSPLFAPAITLDGRMAFTHLSPDEQRAKYLAEQEQDKQGVAAGQQEDDEEEEQAEEPKRRAYPLLADPSRPDRRQLVTGLDGAPLLSHLSPEEQHAEWLKGQKEERGGKDKKGQAEKVGAAGETED